jgi:hypothetical protein
MSLRSSDFLEHSLIFSLVQFDRTIIYTVLKQGTGVYHVGGICIHQYCLSAYSD